MGLNYLFLSANCKFPIDRAHVDILVISRWTINEAIASNTLPEGAVPFLALTTACLHAAPQTSQHTLSCPSLTPVGLRLWPWDAAVSGWNWHSTSTWAELFLVTWDCVSAQVTNIRRAETVLEICFYSFYIFSSISQLAQRRHVVNRCWPGEK